MNFIKSKVRNRLSIEATNKHIYTRHNLMQLEKRKQVGQKGSLAALQWGDDSVEDEEDRFDLEQHDAWQEAMEPECETFEAARDEHIEKAQARYKAVQRSASLQRLPERFQLTYPGAFQEVPWFVNGIHLHASQTARARVAAGFVEDSWRDVMDRLWPGVTEVLSHTAADDLSRWPLRARRCAAIPRAVRSHRWTYPPTSYSRLRRC